MPEVVVEPHLDHHGRVDAAGTELREGRRTELRRREHGKVEEAARSVRFPRTGLRPLLVHQLGPLSRRQGELPLQQRIFLQQLEEAGVDGVLHPVQVRIADELLDQGVDRVPVR
ncbi:hypothetical protein [Kineococcus xinjiangensis]|uniref:hypothetical protein n=1 Tax=Kineococcus xinjiangensis TaxID=512762 RepID=UPI001FE6D6D3|nr:hypothetical protein [Kineococcus xinjiangensis]